MSIKVSDIWQTTELDHYVAEELFGWKWMAFRGRPVRGVPAEHYNDRARVRRFLSPKSLANAQWKDFLAEHDGAPATGEEFLAYCYCSSAGPECVPHFSGHEPAARDMEREIDRRGLRDKYDELLAVQEGAMRGDGTIDHKRLRYPAYENRCIAALATVGSKYVVQDTATHPTGTD